MEKFVTPAGRSVLDDLDLDDGYVVKAKLAVRLKRTIAEMGLSQREAAGRLPISQPKLSLVTRGRLEGVSQAMLEDCLRALGHDIEINISPRHDGAGRIMVREFA